MKKEKDTRTKRNAKRSLLEDKRLTLGLNRSSSSVFLTNSFKDENSENQSYCICIAVPFERVDKPVLDKLIASAKEARDFKFNVFGIILKEKEFEELSKRFDDFILLENL